MISAAEMNRSPDARVPSSIDARMSAIISAWAKCRWAPSRPRSSKAGAWCRPASRKTEAERLLSS